MTAALVAPDVLTVQDGSGAIELVQQALDARVAGIVARPDAGGPLVAPLLDGQPPFAITARELEVLRLVADGWSTAEVGDRLGLSPLTVKRHLSRMMQRADVVSKTALVTLALRAGLLDR